jgi:hypothetical protein
MASSADEATEINKELSNPISRIWDATDSGKHLLHNSATCFLWASIAGFDVVERA